MKEPETQTRAARRGEAATLGMWIFLATEILFVGALFAAYLLVRLNHPQAFAQGSRAADLMLGTVNTAVLLTSSLTMALAVQRFHARDRPASAGWLVASALLGLVFLGIKGVEYWHEWQLGHVPGIRFEPMPQHAPGMELFFFLYFLMTGAHALHLFTGVALVFVFALLVRRGTLAPDYPVPLENLGLYWHFVDVVWIFLFPLLYLVQPA